MSQIVKCPVCGCEHTAADEQIGVLVTCTRCGSAFPAGAEVLDHLPSPQLSAGPSLSYARPTGGTGKATASLVLGIVSLCTCFLYGIPSMVCGILAVVFGRLAKGMIARGEMSPKAAGSARAGAICGTIAIVLSALMWIAMILGFFFMASMAPGPWSGFSISSPN